MTNWKDKIANVSLNYKYWSALFMYMHMYKCIYIYIIYNWTCDQHKLRL